MISVIYLTLLSVLQVSLSTENEILVLRSLEVTDTFVTSETFTNPHLTF